MRNIKGYEKEYLISPTGRVFSLKTDKFLTPHLTYLKYKRIWLYKNGVGNRYYIHRLVAIAYIPNPDSKPEVNHKNKERSDNYYENLEWCTRKENINHIHQE